MEEKPSADKDGARHQKVKALRVVSTIRDRSSSLASSVRSKLPFVGVEDSQGDEPLIPSVLFAIPFPAPVGKAIRKGTPPLLIYTLPRSTYQKPRPQPATGEDATLLSDPEKGTAQGSPKPPKEKLVRKVTRKWQEHVEKGWAIKKGEVQNPTRTARCCGLLARTTNRAMRWIPSGSLETISRLPPKRKIGDLLVICNPATSLDQVDARSTDQVEEDLWRVLVCARKAARRNEWISGILLPITFGIESMGPMPVSFFPINVACFWVYYTGARKAVAITPPEAKERFTYMTPPSSSEVFDPIAARLYELCSHRDPTTFPKQGTATAVPPLTGELIRPLLATFKKSAPPEVQKRHMLKEGWVADDLDRILGKAAKNYTRSLKKYRYW